MHRRDPDLIARMHDVPLVLTLQTTIWKAWIGFNASHSYSTLLFGTVFSYLALFQSAFLFESRLLMLLGFAFLLGLLALSKIYWFSVPFCGMALATALYAAGLISIFI